MVDNNGHVSSSINSVSRSSHNKRYANSNFSRNNSSQETSDLRKRISESRVTVSSRFRPAVQKEAPVKQKNEISSEQTPKPTKQLSREEKLDRVLNLLEDITGEEISGAELDRVISRLDKPDHDGPKLNGAKLRDPENILTKVPNKDSGVKAHEEAAFSDFKLDFYKSQKTGLQNLHEEWLSVNNPEAKQQTAQIEAQMKLVDSASEFWQGRKDSWQAKMEESKLQKGDDAFSVFKSKFYRSQLTGLENLMDQWMSVEDDSGSAAAQRAQIESQINSVEAADEFWVEQNQFWRNEHKSEYAQEDHAAVKEIYGQIENYQNNLDAAMLAETDGNTSGLRLGLEKAKNQLDKYRIGESDNSNDGDSFKTKFSDDKAYADFKEGFYQSQQTDLKNLEEEWRGVKDDSGAARKQITHISNLRQLTAYAQSFWKEQNEFWNKLEDLDFASGKATKLRKLSLKVSNLENKIDEAIGIDDGSSRTQRAHLITELNSVKSEIYSLQNN